MLSRERFRKYTDNKTFDNIKEYDTLLEMWEDINIKYSKREAIIYNDKSFTYEMLNDDIKKFRSVFYDSNVDNEIIGIYVNNSYDFIKAFLSIVTVGYVAMVFPRNLDKNSIISICDKYKVKKIVTDDENIKTDNLFSNYKIYLASQTSNIITKSIKKEKNSDCLIMFTSGSSGKNKAVVLSNEATCQGIVNGCYGYGDVFYQKYILLLPLSHVFGLLRSALTPLLTGGTLYISNDIKNLVKDIPKFNPSIIVLVPALAEVLLSLVKKFGKTILGNQLKWIICGAAPVKKYTIEKYEELGITILTGYGLTEFACLVSGNPELKDSPDSIGMLYPNQEYKIVEDELLLKGKNMMTRYLDEEDNKNIFVDGWFKTGDLIKMDDRGFIYFIGRNKDIIVLENGENISPEEIENQFNQIDDVKDCQVYEYEEGNDRYILALEVLPRDIKKLEDDNYIKELKGKINAINAKLLPNKRINKIIIRDKDFERTPSMKIRRYKKKNV